MPGQRPSFVSTSLWQIPQACTLMRTYPAPGLGISRSTISKSPPGLRTCATLIGATATFVVAIPLILNLLRVRSLAPRGWVDDLVHFDLSWLLDGVRIVQNPCQSVKYAPKAVRREPGRRSCPERQRCRPQR